MHQRSMLFAFMLTVTVWSSLGGDKTDWQVKEQWTQKLLLRYIWKRKVNLHFDWTIKSFKVWQKKNVSVTNVCPAGLQRNWLMRGTVPSRGTRWWSSRFGQTNFFFGQPALFWLGTWYQLIVNFRWLQTHGTQPNEEEWVEEEVQNAI